MTTLMRRWLLPFVAIISAALWVLVVASWVRSYWVADELLRRTIDAGDEGGIVEERGASHARGRWCFFISRYEPAPPGVVVQWTWRRPPASSALVALDTQMRRLGFGFALYNGQSQLRGWMIWAPHWPFALLTPAAPTAWWLARRRRLLKEYRRTHRLCLRCGYDLTGNASGTCPECGTAVELAARA